MLSFLTNEDVIDVGCGSGDVTNMIRRKTTGAVWGIDISPE
jgi:ubiquinone/menaquinone biosynthesis C-methylase UbiE